MKYLFLENKSGRVVRTFLWDRSLAYAVKCLETGRFELWTAQKLETNKHIPLQVLGYVPENFPSQGLSFPQIGTLKPGKPTTQIQCDVKTYEQDRFFYIRSGFIVLLMFYFLSLILQTQVDPQQPKSLTVHIAQQEMKPLVITKPTVALTNTVKKNKTSPGLLAMLAAAKHNTQKLEIDLDIGDASSMKNSVTKGETYQYAKGIFSIPSISTDLERGEPYSKGDKTKVSDVDLNISLDRSEEATDQRASTNGGLNAEEEQALKAFIAKQEGLLRVCYERGLQVFDGFRGNIFLIWKVDDRGMAQNIRVAKLQMNRNSLVNLDEFKKCIIGYLKLWSFPSILKRKTIYHKFQFNRL